MSCYLKSIFPDASLARKFLGMNWLLFGSCDGAAGLWHLSPFHSATWMRNENFWSPQLVWLMPLSVRCISSSHLRRLPLGSLRGAVPLYVLGISGWWRPC